MERPGIMAWHGNSAIHGMEKGNIVVSSILLHRPALVVSLIFKIGALLKDNNLEMAARKMRQERGLEG